MLSAFWVKFLQVLRCAAAQLWMSSFKLSMPVLTDQLPRNFFSPSTEFCRGPWLTHWGSKSTPFDKSVLLRRCEKLLLRPSISPCVISALRPVTESWFRYLLSIRIVKLSVMQHWLYTHSCGSGAFVLQAWRKMARVANIFDRVCQLKVWLGTHTDSWHLLWLIFLALSYIALYLFTRIFRYLVMTTRAYIFFTLLLMPS